MTDRTKIGFLDSGAGGITVLARAVKKLPSADFLYYADTDRVPYGTKTPEEVVRYTSEAVRFLEDEGAQAVVVACNTATSMAIRPLRAAFPFPIVGMEPAVKPAVLGHPEGRILVCATPLTISGEKLHTLIDRYFWGPVSPVLVPLPDLVTLAESERFDEESFRGVIRSAGLEGERFAAVVLGCTHFVYYRELFRETFPGADVIDGNEGTVNRLADLICVREVPGSGSVRFFESGRIPADEDRYRRFLEHAMKL